VYTKKAEGKETSQIQSTSLTNSRLNHAAKSGHISVPSLQHSCQQLTVSASE